MGESLVINTANRHVTTNLTTAELELHITHYPSTYEWYDMTIRMTSNPYNKVRFALVILNYEVAENWLHLDTARLRLSTVAIETRHSPPPTDHFKEGIPKIRLAFDRYDIDHAGSTSYEELRLPAMMVRACDT
jgi:hypothetical protein